MADQRIRVLLVDDQEEDYEITKALLANVEMGGVELHWSEGYRSGLERLRAEGWDVCLLDYFLDEGTGINLLEALQEERIRVPVVMLTGKGDRQVDLEAMKAGAVDYLVKGEIDPALLERSLRYAVERHRTQEALRASEERHRAMFDHLPLGLFRVTPEGEYMEANPALTRMLGHPDPSEIQRLYARHFFVSPADRDAFWRELETRGEVLGFETSLRRPDETLLRVRSTARLHKAPGGRPVYVEGTVEDVTGHRPSHQVEAESTYFRTLFRNAGLGIAMVDSAGRIQEANPVFRELTGLGRAGSGTRTAWSILAPDDQVSVARGFEEVQSGTRERFHERIRLPSDPGASPQARLTLVLPESNDRDPETLLLLLETADAPDGATT